MPILHYSVEGHCLVFLVTESGHAFQLEMFCQINVDACFEQTVTKQSTSDSALRRT